MTTAIAEKSNRTTVKTLGAIDFKTISEPVYDIKGTKIEGYQRIMRPDIGATLSIMSDKYQLVEHREAMAPAVEALGLEGWTIGSSHVERQGASAFVQLEKRDTGIKVVGQQVGLRIMMRNTYDGTTSLRLSFGSLVLICSNGCVVPGKGGIGFDAHHTGDIRDRLGLLTAKVRKIESGLGEKMIDAYSKLDAPVPIEIGREIVKRVMGERKMDQPLRYWTHGIGRNGERTAWNLYNGITQDLTHNFTGGWGRRERKNMEAFDLIAHYIQNGVLPKEEEKN